MREKQVEERIRRRAKEHAGIAPKFTSPGRRSVPDRIVVAPCWAWIGATLSCIEAKAPGKTYTKAQLREKARIEEAGGIVFLADDYESVDDIFELLCDGSCKNAVDS